MLSGIGDYGSSSGEESEEDDARSPAPKVKQESVAIIIEQTASTTKPTVKAEPRLVAKDGGKEESHQAAVVPADAFSDSSSSSSDSSSDSDSDADEAEEDGKAGRRLKEEEASKMPKKRKLDLPPPDFNSTKLGSGGIYHQSVFAHFVLSRAERDAPTVYALIATRCPDSFPHQFHTNRTSACSWFNNNYLFANRYREHCGCQSCEQTRWRLVHRDESLELNVIKRKEQEKEEEERKKRQWIRENLKKRGVRTDPTAMSKVQKITGSYGRMNAMAYRVVPQPFVALLCSRDSRRFTLLSDAMRRDRGGVRVR